MGDSILAWVRQFDSLHFYPKSLEELIYSFALYEMLTEMDSFYFQPLTPKQLKIDVRTLRKDPSALKEVYDKMLICLENWFAVGLGEGSLVFDSEQISTKRLLGKGDISELYFLVETVLVVAVKGEAKEKVIANILKLDEDSQTNLQTLIERALNIKTEPVDLDNMSDAFRKSESVFNSLALSQKEETLDDKINKTIARLERKKNLLQEKVTELEVDNDLLNGLLIDKEKDIYELQAKIAEMAKEQEEKAKSTPDGDIVYIKKIAELEAELKFKDEEIHDVEGRLQAVKEQKKRQMEELMEQISEMKERQNQSYQATKELKFFKDRA